MAKTIKPREKGTSIAKFGAGWDQIKWVNEHRGELSKIAAMARVSPQFAHQVLRGLRSSKDGNVERLLRQAGATIARKVNHDF